MRRFLSILALFIVLVASAQVSAPSLRCISCSSSGNLTLTWLLPPDPGGQFFSYDIYRSVSYTGPYSLAGSVATYTINTFTDATANGNTQSQYYFIKTRWGAAGTNTSTASDTLRSIHLTLLNTPNGRPDLNYNDVHVPKLPTSAAAFDIYKESNLTWAKIKSTPATTYEDTINRCTPILYNYQVQLADNSGCVSVSNIDGAVMQDKTYPLVGNVDSVSVNTSGQTRIAWKPSSSSDCIGYYIYRETGVINKIDSVYGRFNTTYLMATPDANTVSVHLTIAAFDSCKRISPYDAPIQGTIFLKTAYDLCARVAHLTWTDYLNMPAGVLKYDVYCSVNGAGWTKLGSANSAGYDHSNLIPGKTYCYIVRGLNTSQQVTSSSNMACLLASAPPVTGFAYIKAVSVNSGQNVDVTILADSTKPCTGFNIYKADNNGNYAKVAFVPFSGKGYYMFTDADVDTKSKNYFYKVEILDSCGNARYMSGASKTILLKVKNNNDQVFENDLTWDDYSGWLGGIAGYNIYRIVDDVPQSTPINFVPYGRTSYKDNVEDLVKESGKVGYFVEAVEGLGNPYGFSATSTSNISFAYAEGHIFVPNAFAPRGENRKWLPVTQFVEKTEYHVTVFNRWGLKVFETFKDDEGWDGAGQEENVYAYLIQYKNARGEYVELKGTITMVR